MQALIRLSVRWVAALSGLLVVLGALAGGVRLLPWVMASHVPWRVITPFAAVLVHASLEVAAVIGLAAGSGAAAGLLVERGEARALLALGVHPSRLTAGLVLPGAFLAGILAIGAAGSRPPVPGAFVRGLLEAGRAACAAGGVERADVPIVGATWLCLRDGPVLVGTVPGVAGAAWFSARDVEPDERLSAVSLAGLHLGARMDDRGVRVAVERASVRGLSPWGTRGQLGPWRLIASAAAGLLVALVAVARALGRPRATPVLSAAAAAGGATVALMLVRQADAGRGWLLAAASPLLGWLALLAVEVGAAYLGRWRVAGGRP